jgi:hypothetical protein
MHKTYGPDPDVRQRATWAQSEMVLDARHTTNVLDYLLLKNRGVFNFFAFTATIRIATLKLYFMNPTMFDRNIDIRKAEKARVSFVSSPLVSSELVLPTSSSS